MNDPFPRNLTRREVLKIMGGGTLVLVATAYLGLILQKNPNPSTSVSSGPTPAFMPGQKGQGTPTAESTKPIPTPTDTKINASPTPTTVKETVRTLPPVKLDVDLNKRMFFGGQAPTVLPTPSPFPTITIGNPFPTPTAEFGGSSPQGFDYIKYAASLWGEINPDAYMTSIGGDAVSSLRYLVASIHAFEIQASTGRFENVPPQIQDLRFFRFKPSNSVFTDEGGNSTGLKTSDGRIVKVKKGADITIVGMSGNEYVISHSDYSHPLATKNKTPLLSFDVISAEELQRLFTDQKEGVVFDAEGVGFVATTIEGKAEKVLWQINEITPGLLKKIKDYIQSTQYLPTHLSADLAKEFIVGGSEMKDQDLQKYDGRVFYDREGRIVLLAKSIYQNVLADYKNKGKNNPSFADIASNLDTKDWKKLLDDNRVKPDSTKLNILDTDNEGNRFILALEPIPDEKRAGFFYIGSTFAGARGYKPTFAEVLTKEGRRDVSFMPYHKNKEWFVTDLIYKWDDNKNALIASTFRTIGRLNPQNNTWDYEDGMRNYMAIGNKEEKLRLWVTWFENQRRFVGFSQQELDRLKESILLLANCERKNRQPPYYYRNSPSLLEDLVEDIDILVGRIGKVGGDVIAGLWGDNNNRGTQGLQLNPDKLGNLAGLSVLKEKAGLQIATDSPPNIKTNDVNTTAIYYDAITHLWIVLAANDIAKNLPEGQLKEKFKGASEGNTRILENFANEYSWIF